MTTTIDQDKPQLWHKLQEEIATAELAATEWKEKSFEATSLANALEHGDTLFQFAADIAVFTEAQTYVERLRDRQLREMAHDKLDVGIGTVHQGTPCSDLMRRAKLNSWHKLLKLMDTYA